MLITDRTLKDFRFKGEHADTVVLPASIAVPLMLSMVHGAKILFEFGVSHFDIKPDNLLMSDDDSTVVYCDFGESRMMVCRYSIRSLPPSHSHSLSLTLTYAPLLHSLRVTTAVVIKHTVACVVL